MSGLETVEEARSLGARMTTLNSVLGGPALAYARSHASHSMICPKAEATLWVGSVQPANRVEFSVVCSSHSECTDTYVEVPVEWLAGYLDAKASA